MSARRNKKRAHSRTVELKRQMEQERLADEKDRNKKRMNPAARALLLGDLVFLAIVSLLAEGGSGVLSPAASGLCTVIGVVLLIAALWLQFGGGRGGTGPGKGPRL